MLAPAQIRPFIEPPLETRQHNPPADPPSDASADSEHSPCDECGAKLSFSDIFCGVCGHVSPTVSAAFSSARDTSIIESIRPIVPERPADGIAVPRIRPPESTVVSSSSSVQAPVPVAIPAAAISAPSESGAVHADDVDEANAGAGASADLSPDANADADVRDARDVGSPAVAAVTTGERFVLQFSTGESVAVTGTGLVGRNPLSEPGEYFDHLVRVLDSTRSVSKTHLEFGQQAGVFWISDRYSGNGTIVREPDRPGVRCEPGKRQVVVRGARVVIGEQFFVVS